MWANLPSLKNMFQKMTNRVKDFTSYSISGMEHLVEEIFISWEIETLYMNIQDCGTQSYDSAANSVVLWCTMIYRLQSKNIFVFFLFFIYFNFWISQNFFSFCACWILHRSLSLLHVTKNDVKKRNFVNLTQRWQILMTKIKKRQTLKKVNLACLSAKGNLRKSLRNFWHKVFYVLNEYELEMNMNMKILIAY